MTSATGKVHPASGLEVFQRMDGLGSYAIKLPRVKRQLDNGTFLYLM